VLQSGSLSLLEPSGPVQPCNGIALPVLYRPTHYMYIPFLPSCSLEATCRPIARLRSTCVSHILLSILQVAVFQARNVLSCTQTQSVHELVTRYQSESQQNKFPDTVAEKTLQTDLHHCTDIMLLHKQLAKFIQTGAWRNKRGWGSMLYSCSGYSRLPHSAFNFSVSPFFNIVLLTFLPQGERK
jgi:hypothetical protein